MRLKELKYGYIPIMIVQIVLLIVTAVQVNSQELCPSVCQCNSEQAICGILFSDVTDMTQHMFSVVLEVLIVTGIYKTGAGRRSLPALEHHITDNS